MIGSRQIHHKPIGPTEQFIDVVTFSRVSYLEFDRFRLTPILITIPLPIDRTKGFKITRYWCAAIDTDFSIYTTGTPLITATGIGSLGYDVTADGNELNIKYSVGDVVYLYYDERSILNHAIRFGIIYA
jgi:hypothetical protein